MTYRDNEQEPAQSRDSDPKQQLHEKIRAACKNLMTQGFSKDQIAQQLSAKYAMTAAEVSAVLDQDKEEDSK